MLRFDQRESGVKRMVIMGCDGLASSIATSLSEQGHMVHILDLNSEAFDRLPRGKIEDHHIVPIIGDGTRQQDLRRASIEEADVFMALSEVDARNALAVQMARHLYEVPTVICRIDDPTLQQMYTGLGIVAIGATSLVTEMVVEAASG